MWYFGIASLLLLIFAIGFTLKTVVRPRISQDDRNKVGEKANCRCCNISLREDQFRKYKGLIYCNACYNKVMSGQITVTESASKSSSPKTSGLSKARVNSKLLNDGISAYYAIYDNQECCVSNFDEYLGFYAHKSGSGVASGAFTVAAGVIPAMAASSIKKAVTKEKLYQKIYYREISSITYDSSTITFKFTDGVGEKHTLKLEGDSPVLRKLLTINPKNEY